MNIVLKPLKTRFLAYQLGEPGSSFSYFADEHFTLIEAKLTDRSYSSLEAELEACGKTSIDTLHITSWDQGKRLAVPSVQALPDSSSLLFLARMNHGIIETMARSYRSLAKQ